MSVDQVANTSHKRPRAQHESDAPVRDTLRARIAASTTPAFWSDLAATLGGLGADATVCALGKAVAAAINALDDSFEAACQEVEHFRRLTHAAVNDRADKLMQDLTTAHGTKAVALERQLEAVDSTLQSLRSEQAAARDAVETLSDVDLTARHPELSARLDAVDACLRELPMVPLESSALCFESDLSSLICTLASHGTVHGPTAALAVFDRGLSLLLGRGCSADAAAAFALFEQAVAAGNTTAAGYVADMLFLGFGVSKDEQRGRKLFEAAASKGDAFSCAVTVREGWGMPKNERASFQLMLHAATGGHIIAENDVGYAFTEGLGIDKDPLQGTTWYRRSAEQGYASAQFNLGICYDHGCRPQPGIVELLSRGMLMHSSPSAAALPMVLELRRILRQSWSGCVELLRRNTWRQFHVLLREQSNSSSRSKHTKPLVMGVYCLRQPQ
jgi:TPR repeat protein